MLGTITFSQILAACSGPQRDSYSEVSHKLKPETELHYLPTGIKHKK